MSFNLIRNARVFFTTNVDANTGVIASSGATTSNTFELQVLDGFSFSQNSDSETVTLNEAGATPTRGQRSFNTALQPVDFSFTTYVRPQDGGTNITAEEAVLWNAMYATDPIGGASPAWADGVANTTLVLTNSQSHQLQKFGLIIIADNTVYAVDNCALDTATIDFGLDAIAAIAWAGKGAVLREMPLTASAGVAGTVTFSGGKSEVTQIAVDATGGTYTITYNAQTTAAINFDATAAAVKSALEAISSINVGDIKSVTGGPGDAGATSPYLITWSSKLGNITAPTTTPTLTGGAATATVTTPTEGGDLGTAKAKVTSAPFIANKLSTLSITKDIGGGGKAYSVALTGGSITFANNITYLTPANLGVVNKPFTYFTGTRSITGTLNAYLRDGTNNSAGLLADMLAESDTAIDPDYVVQIEIGGITNATRVEVDMPAVVLQIPTVNTDQVIGTTINFTAQGWTGSAFDITQSNEVEVRYYTTNA